MPRLTGCHIVHDNVLFPSGTMTFFPSTVYAGILHLYTLQYNHIISFHIISYHIISYIYIHVSHVYINILIYIYIYSSYFVSPVRHSTFVLGESLCSLAHPSPCPQVPGLLVDLGPHRVVARRLVGKRRSAEKAPGNTGQSHNIPSQWICNMPNLSVGSGGTPSFTSTPHATLSMDL